MVGRVSGFIEGWRPGECTCDCLRCRSPPRRRQSASRTLPGGCTPPPTPPGSFVPFTVSGTGNDVIDPAFEEWAEKVWDLDAGFGTEVSLADFRKDISIELYNEARQLAKAYHVYRCWPSSYQALPELDSNSEGVAIESLVLQHEGWQRDLDVVEPTEVSN